jgi:type II secretory pathway pseudopilin PulG
MLHQKQKTLKGFSLGEVILSVAVLTIGLLPILGAMTGALNTSQDSQETVIAAGLAQEGVELVVNVKDNGVLASNDAFVSFSSGNRTCRIDYNDAVLTNPSSANQIECGNGLSHDLSISGGFYAHTGASGKFKRKVFIDYNVGQQTASIASAVYWSAHVPNDKSTCTTANSCVYSEATLRPWK